MNDQSGVYTRQEENCILCGLCIANCPENAWHGKRKERFGHTLDRMVVKNIAMDLLNIQ